MARQPAKEAASKAVTKTRSGTSAIIRDVDSSQLQYEKGDVGRGTEQFGSEDVSVPRLKLIQGISPELDEYNKLRPGNYLHTAAGFIFDEPFEAVPVFADKRYLLWNPRDSGGGILARADDGVHWSPPNTEFQVKLDKRMGGHTVTWRTAKTVQQSGLANWGTMNPNDPDSPPAATLMYNFLLAFPGHPELPPAVLTFQRSQIGVARKFNGKLKIGPAPLFGRVCEFSSVKTSSQQGDYFAMQVQQVGLIDPSSDLYLDYRAMNDAFTKAGLAVRDLESLQGEGEEDDSEPEQPQGRRKY